MGLQSPNERQESWIPKVFSTVQYPIRNVLYLIKSSRADRLVMCRLPLSSYTTVLKSHSFQTANIFCHAGPAVWAATQNPSGHTLLHASHILHVICNQIRLCWLEVLSKSPFFFFFFLNRDISAKAYHTVWIPASDDYQHEEASGCSEKKKTTMTGLLTLVLH